MDLAQQQDLLKNTKFDDSLRWEDLDAALAALRHGHPLPNPASPINDVARALWARTGLDQWDSLQRLSGQTTQGLISPARMAALKVVVERFPDARMANPPAWVTEGSWTGIRINQLSANDLLGGNIPPFGLKDHIKDVVLSALTELVPAMLSSPAFDKPSMEESLSFEGDVTHGYFSIMFAIPCGDWVPCLLTGQVSLTPHSYVTVLPVGTFAEVPLSGKDCSILKAIGHGLGVGDHAFRMVLNDAWRHAFDTDFATTRFTTSRAFGHGKDRQTVSFLPGSQESVIVVGLDLIKLVYARRHVWTADVHLGFGDENPVTVRITLPKHDQRILTDLVLGPWHAGPALQTRAPGTSVAGRAILVAPLPKNWLTSAAGTSKKWRTQISRQFCLQCNQDIGTTEARFVGRREKGGDPFGLVLEFPSFEAANMFLAHADCKCLPPDFSRAVLRLFPQPLNTFACHVPPEALSSLPEKEFKSVLDRAAAAPCQPLPPPAHAAV